MPTFTTSDTGALSIESLRQVYFFVGGLIALIGYSGSERTFHISTCNYDLFHTTSYRFVVHPGGPDIYTTETYSIVDCCENKSLDHIVEWIHDHMND